MKRKTPPRRIASAELPRDIRAEQILEFVHNDEEEAICSGDFALSHQRDMPAVEEFLQEMIELDARAAANLWH